MTEMTRKQRHWRRWLIALAVLVLAVAAVPVARYVRHRLTRPPSEFHAHVAFVPQAVPAHVVARNAVPWPLYGYSKDHTRDYPAPPTLRPPFHKIWAHGDGALLEFPPTIDNGKLFQLSDDGVLHAISTVNGHPVWKIRLGKLSASTPAVGGSTVYATLLEGPLNDGQGRIVKVSQSHGKVLWAHMLSSRSESSPLLDRGRLYFGSENGTVYALSAHSGHVIWTYHASDPVKASPTYSDGKLYFGDYGGHMQAVDERTGHLIWRVGGHGILGGGNFYSTPAVAFGRVFAGNTDGRLAHRPACLGQADRRLRLLLPRRRLTARCRSDRLHRLLRRQLLRPERLLRRRALALRRRRADLRLAHHPRPVRLLRRPRQQAHLWPPHQQWPQGIQLPRRHLRPDGERWHPRLSDRQHRHLRAHSGGDPGRAAAGRCPRA